jgi:hypothetical protein
MVSVFAQIIAEERGIVNESVLTIVQISNKNTCPIFTFVNICWSYAVEVDWLPANWLALRNSMASVR